MSPKHHHSARSPRCPRLEQRSHYRSEDETVSARQLCPRGDSSQGHESRVPCCGYLTHAPRPEAARLVGRGQAAAERYTGMCVIAAGAECSRTRKRFARQFRARPRPEAVVVMYQVARRESQRLSGDRAAGRRSRSATRPIHRRRADRCQAPEWRAPAYRDCAVEGVEHIIDRLAGQQHQDGELTIKSDGLPPPRLGQVRCGTSTGPFSQWPTWRSSTCDIDRSISRGRQRSRQVDRRALRRAP